MKKILSSILCFTVFVTGLVLGLAPNPASANELLDLGNGYVADFHGPHGTAQPDYHVHVKNRGKEVATAKMNGDKSHGRTLDSLPNKTKEKLLDSGTYKKYNDKQKKLEETRSKAKKINWWNPIETTPIIIALIAAVGFALYTTVTGWKNFVFA
jgi:hypothetical protein